jgi:small subunit ribosomal protein S8
MTQFIINFLLTLKNASSLKKEKIKIKYSKHSLELVVCLYNEGFIHSYQLKNNQILIILRYFFNKPILKNLKIISTPSKLRYLNLKALSKLSNKKTSLFFSTSKGLLTLNQCKKNKIGGILLFLVS